MHVHTVLVKLHDSSTRDRCAEAMESMRGRIEGLLDLRVDRNEIEGDRSCDIALTTAWPDLAAYRAYERDPVHLEVREVVLELMQSALTIDYTVEP